MKNSEGEFEQPDWMSNTEAHVIGETMHKAVLELLQLGVIRLERIEERGLTIRGLSVETTERLLKTLKEA